MKALTTELFALVLQHRPPPAVRAPVAGPAAALGRLRVPLQRPAHPRDGPMQFAD